MIHKFLNSPQQNSSYSNNYQLPKLLYKHFKNDSEQKLLIGRWVLNGRNAYSTKRISKIELHKRGLCLRYMSLRCKNYENLNVSLKMRGF